MNLAGLYDYLSLSLSILSGVVITLSIYYLYLRSKEKASE